MKHTMKVDIVPLSKIKNGIKKIESRIYDDKRKVIEIGDEIEFVQNNNPEIKQRTKVIGLLRYNSFSELFEDQIDLFGGDSKSFLLEEIYQFLSIEKEEKYGVLGIRIKIID